MPDCQALGMLHVGLQARRQKAGRRRAEHDVGPAARHAAASKVRLTSSRSGALSWTKSTPATASSTLAANVSSPSAEAARA